MRTGPRDEPADGKVKASYPAATSPPEHRRRGIQAGQNLRLFFGAAELFDRDDYGADYMRGTYPWRQMSPEQCNALFERMGELLGDVFTFAHRLGVKTCIGTETP